MFGYEGAAAEEMMYLNWLHQLHMALVSLQAYNVADGGWSQSHCCARHVYLQVLLRHTQGLVWIEPTRAADGRLTDFVIRVDRSKIRTEGRRAIGDFLLHLQLYKSCADVAAGHAVLQPVHRRGRHLPGVPPAGDGAQEAARRVHAAQLGAEGGNGAWL